MKAIEIDLDDLLNKIGGGSRSDGDGTDERMRKTNAELRREEREDPAIYCRKLLDLAADYHNRGDKPATRFKIGDLVQTVPGSPYKFWSADRPGIVIEVLGTPAFDESVGCGSPDFRLPLDMRLATIRGGEFLIYHVHSGYFENYTGPVLDS